MRQVQALLVLFALTACDLQKEPVEVLLITGGKKYEREHFLEFFNNLENITYRELIHPEANAVYSSPEINNYEVIVYYDFVQEITDEQKEAFLAYLKKGGNLVFLHHSLACYQDWDEYEKIVGGRYYHSKNRMDSLVSTYRHGVDIPVKIVDKNHPITSGMDDFIIHDEVYGNFKILEGVKPLLLTHHPENERLLAWTHQYANARVVFIQLGHDHHAYEDSNFRKVVQQSIAWAADQ